MAHESPAFTRLKAICLSFPEAKRQPAFDMESFRVREKIFVWCVDLDGAESIIVKGRPGDRDMLMAANPDRFRDSPYRGLKGWFSIRLNDDTDWDEVEDLITTSYRLIAPKRLAALLPD